MADFVSDKKQSLKWAINRTVLIGLFILLVLSINIVHIMIIVPSMEIYKRQIRNLNHTLIDLIGEDYILDTFEMAKEIYYSTPEEIRADEFSDEYKQIIIPYIDDAFIQNRNIVSLFRENYDYDNIAFVFFDDQMQRLVFVIDGNDYNLAYLPAQWVSDENGDIESLSTIKATVKSGWYMPIAYGRTSGFVGTDYEEIYGRNGELAGYIAVNLTINDLSEQIRSFLMVYVPIMLLVIIWVQTRILKRIKYRVIKPVTELTEHARRYKAIDKREEEYISVFSDLTIDTKDEIEELFTTMVEMEKDVEKSIGQIKRDAAAKEKIATELELARSIQEGALPADFDNFPGDDDFEICAMMKPAKDVGGDFYDFFRVDDTHIGLVIADVSGKGIPAALFMMNSKSIIRNNVVPGRRPAEVLKRANNIIAADNPNLMFLTAWLGIMDTRTGEVVAANAGHEYPFVTESDGNLHLLEDTHGVVIGCVEGMEYEDYSFTIPKGGMMFVYTDGVAEANNEVEELYGTDRLEKTLNRFKDLSPAILLDAMKEELDKYKGNKEQFDDITMMVLRR